MFNTTINRTEYGGPSTIKELRAPTDDSVKLLREMEDKILDNILEVGRINDNSFNCRWTIVFNGMEFTDTVYCKFSINGEDHQFKFDLPKRHGDMNGHEFATLLREKIADKVVDIFGNSLWNEKGTEIINIYKTPR